MKISAEEVLVKPAFTPINLTLTFESKIEIDEFYAIFNLSILTDTLPHIDQSSIRNQLRELTGNGANKVVFTRLNKAMKAYD